MKTNWKKEEKDILKKRENGESVITLLGSHNINDEDSLNSFYEYCKKKNSPLTESVESYINKKYKESNPPILWIFLSLLVIANILMGIFYGFWILIPLILIELFSAFVGAYIMMLMEREEKKVKGND